MKKLLSAVLLCLSPLAQAADPPPRAVTAEIIPIAGEQRSYGVPIGNVRVIREDGSKRTLTENERNLDPRCSPGGLVGWVWFDSRNSYGEPVTASLRVRFRDGSTKDFEAPYFIRQWKFSPDEKEVWIETGYRHGPSKYRRFDLESGELREVAKLGATKEETPAWVVELDPRSFK